MSQGINEQIRPITAIESEFHFLQVGREMLCADFVPCADNTALQKREGRFNGVGVNVPLHVNLELVANRLVASILSEIAGRAPVSIKIIREQHVYVRADILLDESAECTRLYIVRMEEPEFASSLADTDYDFLVLHLVFPTASRVLSADERLIHFNFAREHRPVRLHHRGANPMAEVPCRLVADSKRPLNLARAHTLLGFAEKVRSSEPLFERQMGIIENGASCYRELITA